MLKLNLVIVNNDGDYTGWISGIKGVIAQGASVEEITKELLECLSIKFEVQSEIDMARVHGFNSSIINTMELNLAVQA